MERAGCCNTIIKNQSLEDEGDGWYPFYKIAMVQAPPSFIQTQTVKLSQKTKKKAIAQGILGYFNQNLAG
ncbi:hypothetical protein [Coleofasciculus sp. C1-SOL-03]|jgi:hypothetical protein|uniref:hypothetical protein n=1 Tax=Coleofasciculus sp. C1-SOL-03 TaxID=3069522 RepID=UPI004064091D